MAGTTRANAPSELDIEAARWFFQNTVDIFVLIRSGTISLGADMLFSLVKEFIHR